MSSSADGIYASGPAFDRLVLSQGDWSSIPKSCSGWLVVVLLL